MTDNKKITVRPWNMKWPEDLPKYWYDNNPFATHYHNAISLFIPDGERMLMETVREFLDPKDNSPEMKAVKELIGQESWHHKMHVAFNSSLDNHNLPAKECVRKYHERAEAWRKKQTNMDMLAGSVAFEHMTSIFARELLGRQDNCKCMHPHFAAAWRWHAVEELEHKSVVFDLYRKVGGSYWLRTWFMVYVIFRFNLDVALNMYDLLKADGLLWKPRTWYDACRYLFGFGKGKGWYWGALPELATFFRPGYHPNELNDEALIQETLSIMAKEKSSAIGA